MVKGNPNPKTTLTQQNYYYKGNSTNKQISSPIIFIVG